MAFEEYKGSDGVKNQSTVSGDTVSDALETLNSAITAEDIWDRTGTTIVPKNAGDDLDIGTGSITAAGLKVNGNRADFFGDGTGFVHYYDDLRHMQVVGTAAETGIAGIAGAGMFLVGGTGGSFGFATTSQDGGDLPLAGTQVVLFYVDAATGNSSLGDNITSPSAKLDIVVADTENVPALELNNNDTTNNPDTLIIANTTSGADTTINSLKTIESSEAVADDGTITLPTGVAGWLQVWEDVEWLHCHITSAGVVTSINGSTNSAATDSDGKLCVYDGGAGAIIKNRLGAQKTIRYFFKYS
jgi:hypothetical protein